MRGSVVEANKNDPFDGAEFRCGAAKAFNYISFYDKDATGWAPLRGLPETAQRKKGLPHAVEISQRFEIWA
ncbi:MAG: hypothetical protein OSB38_01790 [Paraburkholderia fungorum]|nr:hypothetical protein [Paraburkholderia fungorum]